VTDFDQSVEGADGSDSLRLLVVHRRELNVTSSVSIILCSSWNVLEAS
jgi:hypothetical protein